MGNIPLPALAIKPPVQQEGPIDQYAKAISLKNMMAQQQLVQGQQQLQQLQIAKEQQAQAQKQALDSAFANAITPTPDGKASFNQQKVLQSVAQSGQGSLVPQIQKTFMDLDHLAGQVQETRDKHAAAAQDYMGAIAKSIKDSNYDPAVAGTLLAHAATNGYEKEAIELHQAIGQDPTKLKQIVDQVLAQSPKQQQLDIEQQRVNKQPVTEAALALKASQGNVDAQKALDKLKTARIDPVQKQILDDYIKKHPITKGHPTGLSDAALALKAEGARITVNAGEARRTAAEEEKLSKEGLQIYTPALDAQLRYKTMQESETKALKGDQQAMFNLVANHVGMVLGIPRGKVPRISTQLYQQAEQAAPILQQAQAHFDKDGYLSGIVLTPEQMRSMVDLGKQTLDREVEEADQKAQYRGITKRPQSLSGGAAPAAAAPAAKADPLGIF